MTDYLDPKGYANDKTASPKPAAHTPTPKLADGIYQDGGRFYCEGLPGTEDEGGDMLLADYSGMVLNDYDTKGAARARLHFIAEFPEHAAKAEGGAK